MRKNCDCILEHSIWIEFGRKIESSIGNNVSEFVVSVATKHFPENETQTLSHHALNAPQSHNLCTERNNDHQKVGNVEHFRPYQNFVPPLFCVYDARMRSLLYA